MQIGLNDILGKRRLQTTCCGLLQEKRRIPPINQIIKNDNVRNIPFSRKINRIAEIKEQIIKVNIIRFKDCTCTNFFFRIRPTIRYVIEVPSKVNGIDSLIKCIPITLLKKNNVIVTNKKEKLQIKNFLLFIL